MKLTHFTSTQISKRQVQIFFIEPLAEKTDAYEIRLFLEYFKKNKRVSFFYKLKPEIRIDGLICDAKTWVEFLANIQQTEVAKGYYELMRDIPFLSVDEVEAYLRLLQKAELKVAEEMHQSRKNHLKKNNPY